jgi:hypothetical protein
VVGGQKVAVEGKIIPNWQPHPGYFWRPHVSVVGLHLRWPDFKICPSTSFFKAIIPILPNYNTPILPILPSPTSDLNPRSKKKKLGL